MGALQRVFGRYQKTATKDQVGGTLARLKGVHEMLADVVEATKELDILEALKDASPWAEAVGNALGDALPPVRFVLKLFEELNKIEDPGELGYLAATLAYQQAVEQAWQAMPPEVLAQVKAADPKLRKKALADLRATTPAAAYDFSRFSFDQALSSPFIKDAERFLELSAQGLLDEAAYRNLQHGVRVRFVANLKSILSHGSTRDRFAPFRELMRLDTREARAYDALHEHADYQRWLYEEQKVLGSEPFTLAQVYTDTDCGVLRWADCTRKNEHQGGLQVDPFREEFGGRHPLIETVLSLIADPKFKDAIVIQGVAGWSTSAGQTSARQSSAGQTSPGQTSARQTSSGQTSAGQISAGQALAGQTSIRQTSARQTSVRQTSARQTSTGQASTGQASTGQASTELTFVASISILNN